MQALRELREIDAPLLQRVWYAARYVEAYELVERATRPEEVPTDHPVVAEVLEQQAALMGARCQRVMS